MEELASSIVLNVASSFVYDVANGICKFICGDTISTLELKKCTEKLVRERYTSKYDALTTTDIIETFLTKTQVKDMIQTHIFIRCVGRDDFESKEYVQVKKNKTTLKDLLDFFSKEILKEFSSNDSLIAPPKELIYNFLEFLVKCIEEAVFLNLNEESKKIIYFINTYTEEKVNGINNLINNIQKLMISISKENLQYDPNFEKVRDEYHRIMRKKNSEAHIYLLDKFPFKDFYVPPILLRHTEEKLQYDISTDNLHLKYIDGDLNIVKDMWKYIFIDQNIIYITGGAGYGKSLFLKKIINDFQDFCIYKAEDYLVIYGELKTFYVDGNLISVLDFLQNSMKASTLMDNNKLSKEMITYYLNLGRCIILLDALDEVDNSKRSELHETLIAYFKNQNPNNKVCITTRDRGFIPEKTVDLYTIEPLNNDQIERYVDKIIALKKFAKSDKSIFMKRAHDLVEKGFLNSFLVLSLLLNIYKAEQELPENKLDLYEKCFNYISNKREKEKNPRDYDWQSISPLLKDSTFIELSKLCFPNNKAVDKNNIKDELVNMYSNKYGSEVKTENAIDEFLRFCSDRTELFVPASEENKFKFFHRSFFEYFYAQYIFLNFDSVEEIVGKMRCFNVDSEVFELTIAMLKQKAEKKYQEVIRFLLNSACDEFEINVDYTIFNILVLSMQVVDDVFYKEKFKTLLVDKKDLIINNYDVFHNLGLIPDMFKNNTDMARDIYDAYYDDSVEILLKSFLSLFSWLENVDDGDVLSVLDSFKNEDIDYKIAWKNSIKNMKFFFVFFLNYADVEKILDNITPYEINVLLKQNSRKTKKYLKYLNLYREFDDKNKKAFLFLLLKFFIN